MEMERVWRSNCWELIGRGVSHRFSGNGGGWVGMGLGFRVCETQRWDIVLVTIWGGRVDGWANRAQASKL